MTEIVTYKSTDQVSTITMDDGKVNVFSLPMLSALHEAFNQGERDGTVVVLEGRPGCFSAGFDLRTLAGPPQDALTLLRSGAGLAERILSFPAPVVAACTGHAFPAGAFLLMAADVRLGADGAFRLGLNEVRIGLTLPWFAIVLARHRLTPAHFDRTAVTGEMFDPHTAREAGLLDAVVSPAELSDRAQAVARDLCALDRSAHAATKLRVRKPVLDELRQAVEAELPEPSTRTGTGHPAPSGP
jgi:enoyl-CoA hydratase/carnithine racemase